MHSLFLRLNVNTFYFLNMESPPPKWTFIFGLFMNAAARLDCIGSEVYMISKLRSEIRGTILPIVPWY
jgi:hypothetical protein